MKTLLKRKRGQMMVLVAVALVALLGALALCADLSVFYFNWSELQKCADASALAGANYLPGNTTQATTTAASYVQLNGSKTSEIVTNQVGNGNLGPNTTLTVGLQRTVPYYFARVLGLTSGPVGVQAIAQLANVGGASGILPVGLPCSETIPVGDNCGYTPSSVHKLQLVSGQVAPGDWELLNLEGTGGAGVRTDMNLGYNGPLISVGQYVDVNTKPGNTVGPVVQGLTDRLSRSHYADGPPPATIDCRDSRAALVPLVNFGGINGASQVPVEGFAVMWISSVVKSGKNAGTINAYFTTCVAGDPAPGSNGANTGALAVTLIK